jgi:transcriptional regulator with XRE-family HTH domain
VNTAPSIRRRLIGSALRRYREGLGLALDDAARIISCDRSRISRIETGQRGVRAGELRTLLTEYGAADQAATLTAIAGISTARGWWREYASIIPDARQDYFALEMAASEILLYEAQKIPELFQTRAYARALADVDVRLADDNAREKAADAVLARQRAVLDERKPDIRVVIGEAALRQMTGGPDVMKAQLALLAETSRLSSPATIQVLPFQAGAHAAASVGSLAILRFPGTPALGVVHQDGASGGTFLDDQADLATYIQVFEHLRAFALTPDATAAPLQDLAA